MTRVWWLVAVACGETTPPGEIDVDLDGFFADVDCDDADPGVNPGAAEVAFDGVDNDCDPLTLDDDGDLDGVPVADDCDDADPLLGGAEVAGDGVDNDCDPATPDAANADEVCARWAGDRADRTEGAWDGSVGTCDPGELGEVGQQNTLKIVNLYRWLAALEPVTLDPSKSDDSQACALLMDANDALSHTPPNTWDCFTDLGATAAGQSSIATVPAVQAVDLYMVDPGNETTLGHRRWILGNWIGPIGVGSTSSYSCLHVFGTGVSSAPWVAWPPAGAIPLEAFAPVPGFGHTDDTGWSLQSDTIDLSAATVTVTRDGADLPVTVVPLLDFYGSTEAISFFPDGWGVEVGRYEVAVGGVASPFSYTVEVLGCG